MPKKNSALKCDDLFHMREIKYSAIFLLVETVDADITALL